MDQIILPSEKMACSKQALKIVVWPIIAIHRLISSHESYMDTSSQRHDRNFLEFLCFRFCPHT